MNERPSLRDVLGDLAGEVNAVDLSDRVTASRRRLRRQRAASAVLAVVAVVGAGGFAWNQAPSDGAARLRPGVSVTASAHPVPTAVATTCCPVSQGTPVSASPVPSYSGFFASAPSGPLSTHPAAPSSPPVTLATTAPAGATARPPSATPPEAVPAGHGCASPWTDESSGNGSPFASSAQREAAASMGTALCGHLGATKVTRLVEWISVRGLNHVGEGVTYDIQASGPGLAVYLEVFVHPGTPPSASPVVTSEGGALRAQWGDGVVVLMTKGNDSALARQIVTDPAFDALIG